MPIQLTIAYVIFCSVPLVLGLSISLRQQRVQRSLDREKERAGRIG